MSHAVRERPILFSGPMIRALLDGRKTVTRRVVKPQPKAGPEGRMVDLGGDGSGSFGLLDGCLSGSWRCPYGRPGDRLWCREEHYRFGHWEPLPGVRTKTGRMKWAFVADSDEVLYEAPESYRKGRHHQDPETPAWHKRLARFMPRALCRITLEITEVSVERVQEITADDAYWEGVPDCDVPGHDDCFYGTAGHRCSFKRLWDGLHEKRGYGWDANPWVWRIAFRRLP